MTGTRHEYAFPHTNVDEGRRLELLEARFDPATIRRVERLELTSGSRCLEVGGGRGSITRWLCGHVGPRGHVTATDLDPGWLAELSLPNLRVLRHDVRADDFPEDSFDLIHARAVLMHLPERMATLRRMVSWLAPGGWLLVEDCDFGMWTGDLDPLWAAYPRACHEAFPNMSLGQGRALLRQICQLGLEGIGADADLDIVQPGTPLGEFYRLSAVATAQAVVAAGALTAKEIARIVSRLEEPDFLGCGFAYIGAWGRRPPSQATAACESQRSNPAEEAIA
jgi:SAM-dependent methyltransferase